MLLGPIDGKRLARAAWMLALVVYGLHLATSVATLVSTLVGRWDQIDTFTISIVLLPTLLRTLEPALWLLIVRLLIEACDRLLGERPEQS